MARKSRYEKPVELQIVYGGQWGSEGKGRICAHLAMRRHTPHMIAVRVGGPNAGHTITDNIGRTLKLQQIPAAAYVSRTTPLIGPSGLIIPEILIRELEWLGEVWPTRASRPVLYIDPATSVILPRHMAKEQELKTLIGSTGEGVGAATAEKVMRVGQSFRDWLKGDLPTEENGAGAWIALKALHNRACFQFAHTQEVLTRPYGHFKEMVSEGLTVQLEGTQGYLLSLNTGGYYPYCTSRDCGPDAIAAQVGISTRLADNRRIVCVMRTFPIRVGGNSGPMGEELSWEDMKNMTGGYVDTPEITTVTKKIRRIARFDHGIAQRVGLETCPDEIAITFMDYLYPALNALWKKQGINMLDWSLGGQDSISVPAMAVQNMLEFANYVQETMQAPVRLVSVGEGAILSI